MTEIIGKLQLAVSTAIMDFPLIIGFGAINIGSKWVEDNITPQIPYGLPRTAGAAAVSSAADVAKFVLYQISMAKT